MTFDALTALEEAQRSTGLSASVIASDMMQSRILSAMFDSSLTREIALKGGLAMHAAYRSKRYTKDIDLQSSQEVPMARVKSIVESAIKVALTSGIIEEVSVSAPKQTDTVQRWKVNGKISGGGSPVNLTVEVSRRGMPQPKLMSTIALVPSDEGVKPAMLEVYSPTAIAGGKVDALLSPNRIAVRDLYDLQLLISMDVRPPVEILRGYGKEKLTEALKEVWAKIELMPWELARDDLKPFLSKEAAELLTEDAWEEMRIRTGEFVTTWLQKALDEEIGQGPKP